MVINSTAVVVCHGGAVYKKTVRNNFMCVSRTIIFLRIHSLFLRKIKNGIDKHRGEWYHFLNGQGEPNKEKKQDEFLQKERRALLRV